MFERVVGQILLLKGYMVWAAAGALLFGLLYRISLAGFGWDKRIMRIHGYFIGLSGMDQLRTSLFYLRLALLVWCLVSMDVARPVYVAMLLCFGGLLGALSRKLRKILEEIGNTAMLLGGMYAAGLLLAYMREIQFEWNIFLVYVLLGVFMVLYSLYFFLRDIKEVSAGKKWNEPVKKNQNRSKEQNESKDQSESKDQNKNKSQNEKEDGYGQR